MEAPSAAHSMPDQQPPMKQQHQAPLQPLVQVHEDGSPLSGVDAHAPSAAGSLEGTLEGESRRKESDKLCLPWRAPGSSARSSVPHTLHAAAARGRR